MKNTSEHPRLSLILSSPTTMKNKARLSLMTAFSFGYHLKHQKTDQPYPFKKVTIRVFFLRFTSQNETSNSSLIHSLAIHAKTMQWRSSPWSGIIL